MDSVCLESKDNPLEIMLLKSGQYVYELGSSSTVSNSKKSCHENRMDGAKFVGQGAVIGQINGGRRR